ncbi:hypothetical protein MRX96_040656 [Rhipicephalus microplus]
MTTSPTDERATLFAQIILPRQAPIRRRRLSGLLILADGPPLLRLLFLYADAVAKLVFTAAAATRRRRGPNSSSPRRPSSSRLRLTPRLPNVASRTRSL